VFVDEKENKRSKPDPRAWIRKYFIMAEDSWLWEEVEISGMKESKFNSSPTQIESQELLEIAINVPNAKVEENREVNGVNE